MVISLIGKETAEMSNRQKFEQDLTVLLSRLTKDSEKETENKLNLAERLAGKAAKRKHFKNQPFRDGACLRQIPYPKRLRGSA